MLFPAGLYDVPLTIRVPVPGSWKAATVIVGHDRKAVTAGEGHLDFEIPPRARRIRVERL